MTAREQRLQEVNGFIRVVAGCGQQFFRSRSGVVSEMIEFNGRLYWLDKITRERLEIRRNGLHRGFSDGGTLRSLVLDLADFVRTGEKLPCYTFRSWGYGAQNMRAVQLAAELAGLWNSAARSQGDG